MEERLEYEVERARQEERAAERRRQEEEQQNRAEEAAARAEEEEATRAARRAARREEILSRETRPSPPPVTNTPDPQIRNRITQLETPEATGTTFYEVYHTIPLLVNAVTLGQDQRGEYFRYLGGRIRPGEALDSQTVPIPHFVARTVRALSTPWRWMVVQSFVLWQPGQPWARLLIRTKMAELSAVVLAYLDELPSPVDPASQFRSGHFEFWVSIQFANVFS